VIKTKHGLIKGRGANQVGYLQKIFSHDVNFGIGPAGTGKTYLAVACAVHALQTEQVRKIILVRPAVEAGEKLGFLPGDMAQKVDPYLRPLYDALHEMLGLERVEKMLEKGVIEVAPLAFMRGRAQPISCRVLTPQGWRKMGELSVGDEVIGSNGQPTKVLAIYPQGEKTVYRITTSDKASTFACEEHLWAVKTPSDKRRNKDFRILETKQMRENLRAAQSRRYELPIISQPVQFSGSNQLLPLDPYALGLLLGDGCITGKTTPIFSTNDAELVEAMNLALKPLNVTLSHKANFDYVLSHDNKAGSTKNPISVALRELDLEGTYSNSKFIPPLYLQHSSETRLAILQGLLDSDGSACPQNGRSCRIHYSTNSPHLRDDVIYLVRSLGGIAYCRTRFAEGRKPGLARGREVPHRNDSFIIDIRLSGQMQPFRLARKLNTYFEHGSCRPMRFIESITEMGVEQMQCIQVDADDHLYVTDDFIVTHNTLNNAFIILDEAQNTTLEQIKMFLTRLGFGSTAVITGDITQIDLPNEKMSGLRHIMNVLQQVNGISFTYFSARDVVRHPLVQRIIEAYEAFEKQQNTSK
jgi:phosphate starvation-inducible protein PhoH and related proteins